MISDLFSNDKFRLGFGLMRLPKLEDGKTIDVEQMKTMVDMFIAAGGTYFDTAYVYDGGGSERAAKEALVDRYPRDSFTLATKLNARISSSTPQCSLNSAFAFSFISVLLIAHTFLYIYSSCQHLRRLFIIVFVPFAQPYPDRRSFFHFGSCSRALLQHAAVLNLR